MPNLKTIFSIPHPHFEAMKKQGISREQLPGIIHGYIKEVNHRVPKYMKNVDHEIRETEFEKTPKRNIKRFIYQ
ncbi:MAG: long-chain fatty acid--CoA ligase [Bacteroidetes bacterium]|nr:long-chain fatty acid--CoA ligase [Bacteroidota bacterium]